MKTVTIAGKLGRDAETKQVGQDGVTSFSVAVDSREKIDGTWTKTTVWFDCDFWGKRGQSVSQYLVKGTSVCVSGDLGMRTYQAKDGKTKAQLTVKVGELTLMGSKADREGGAPREDAPRRQEPRREEAHSAPAGFDDFADDDIPFR